MPKKWHPGYLLERAQGRFGRRKSRGLSSGNPKKELTLCLTHTDVFEVKRRINELEDKDRSKMRAGYYFEEALSELEEQKFKEKKKGNPVGNPRTLSPVDEMWRRKDESELREVERSGLVSEEGMKMLWDKFRKRWE